MEEADAAEWQARRAVIEKQAEEARREKQRRRAQTERDGEKARRSQVRNTPDYLHSCKSVTAELRLHDECSFRYRLRLVSSSQRPHSVEIEESERRRDTSVLPTHLADKISDAGERLQSRSSY